MNAWQARLAVRALRGGGLVLHATEGVWGLACDPGNSRAVEHLLACKERSVAKGLIVIGAGPECFAAELESLQGTVRARVEASWPGPETWVVPNQTFPPWITGGRRSVAMRVPGHPQARALCRAFGGPLVSSSANRSGRPPPRRRLQAMAFARELRRRGLRGGGAPEIYVLPGESQGRQAPSHIRTVTGITLRGTP